MDDAARRGLSFAPSGPPMGENILTETLNDVAQVSALFRVHTFSGCLPVDIIPCILISSVTVPSVKADTQINRKRIRRTAEI